jgi:hypothetical protein
MTPKQAYWSVVYMDSQIALEEWQTVVQNATALTVELKKRSEEWNKEVYEPQFKRAERELALMPAKTEILTLAVEYAKMKAQEAVNAEEANSGAEKLG